MLPPRKRTCSKLQIDLEMRKHVKSNNTGLLALCLPVPFQILLGFQAGSKWATLTVPEENKLHTASCGYKMMQYEVPQKILQCDMILRMVATCCNCTSLARVSFFQWFVQQLFAFCFHSTLLLLARHQLIPPAWAPHAAKRALLKQDLCDRKAAPDRILWLPHIFLKCVRHFRNLRSLMVTFYSA